MKLTRKLLVVLLGGLLSLGALNAFASAHADEKEVHWGTMPDEDGDGLPEEVFVYSDDGPYLHFVIIYSADDTEFSWWENPNPDEDSSGTDPQGLQDAINHAKNNVGGDLFVGMAFEASPLGSMLEGHGEGPSAVWNPSDDDDSGVGNPMAGIDVQEIIDLGEGAESEGEIDGDAGSPAQQIKDKQGGGEGDVIVAGGNDGNDGVVDLGPGKEDDPAWTYFGPIVNPNPEESRASSQTPDGTSDHSEVEQEQEVAG